jgi:hypothetical protein
MFISTSLPTILLIVFSGVVVSVFVNRSSVDLSITLGEFLVVLSVFSLITIIVVQPLGYYLAKKSLLSFREYRSGSLTGYRIEYTTCYRDGSCEWTYSCDPYQDCHTVCDSKDEDGRCTSSHEECVTRYHQCPYVEREYDYVLLSEIGGFTVAAHRFPENPNDHRWRSWEYIPGWVISDAGVGPTQTWLYYRDRMNAGIADAVTGVFDYENYILASEQTTLREHSTRVGFYRDAHLLPGIARGTHNHFLANKVSFLGYQPTADEANAWQDALMRLNAALGSELQGDVRLVIIQSDIITNSLDYLIALKAYWQDTAIWGDDALPGNAIVIVVGTDGQQALWARATTGMPVGNESLTNEVERRLRHIREDGGSLPLTPGVIIGDVRRVLTGDPSRNQTTLETIHGGGYLEDILWGITRPETRFSRVSMKSEDEDDKGSGYKWLDNEIQPTAGQKRLIIFVGFLLSWFGWAAAIYAGEKTGYRSRWF